MKVYSADSVAPSHVPHGEGVDIRWLITTEHGAPRFAMRIIEVQPGGGTPFHAHPEEHEVYILEGKGGLLDAEKREMALAEGDVAFVLPDEQHQFVNRGETMLRFICVVPLLLKKG